MGLRPLPAMLLDPRIPPLSLQERWVQGARGSYERLLDDLAYVAKWAALDPSPEMWQAVVEAYTACCQARDFLNEAEAALRRYRQTEKAQLPSPR